MHGDPRADDDQQDADETPEQKRERRREEKRQQRERRREYAQQDALLIQALTEQNRTLMERISGVELETMARQNEQVLTALPRLAAPAFPALLALESLLALALAWTLYHRFSRARIGEPLGRLKEFRFNDQLVWGLIVAVALVRFGVNFTRLQALPHQSTTDHGRANPRCSCS